MLRYLQTKEVDVIQEKNINALKTKIAHLKDMSTGNVEEEIVDLLVTELVMQGKDANQIRQISQISKVLGLSLGLGNDYCNTLEVAAKIYDIGNIAICSEVYEKDEKLTFEEFEIVKKHTLFGKDMLENQGFSSTDMAAIISAEHHEWWNGGGYPNQLREKTIDRASRIVALADTVGALFRQRPGRKVWSYDKILEYISSRRGLQFDPDFVDVFLINKEVVHEILSTDLEELPNTWYT